jgi:hypothetical protein
MQNAEANPSQSQQNEMAAKSRAKTPAAGSASPDAATQAKEFGSSKHATSADGSIAKKSSPLPPIEVDPYALDSGAPVIRANSRIGPRNGYRSFSAARRTRSSSTGHVRSTSSVSSR